VKAELLLNLQLILGTSLLILLGVFTFLLINRIRQRREQLTSGESGQPAFPYPYRRDAEPDAGLFNQPQTEADALITSAYAHWLENFLLPDAEPGRAFVRTGVAKNWLRYQLTATSLAQAAGMLACVLQAGADPLAQTRFDALLAFCLSRPSVNNPDLMRWQVMPDVVPGARLDADPRAEAWLAFALLCGAAQWTRSSRFDYTQLAKLRLDALLAWLNSGNIGAPQSRLISLAFARLFQRSTSSEGWLKAASPESIHAGEPAELDYARDAQSAAPDEEAQHALLALAYGVLPDNQTHGKPADSLPPGSDLVNMLANLKDRLGAASSQSDGFSPLSVLACFAAAASGSENAELSRAYWDLLSRTEAPFGDGLAATLRLIGLMALNGNLWFAEAFSEPPSFQN